jgi:hypothetical protein
MVNKFKTITSFIKSSNRSGNEKIYNFSIDYPDGVLTCGADEYMEINVISFDMINTMYNINNTNNQFIIRYSVGDITYTIPVGNYSVKTFMATIAGLIKDDAEDNIIISYNTPQNTYTFAKKAGVSATYTLIPNSIWGLVNMLPTVPYEITTAGFNTGYINLVNYSKIILRTEGINYYYSNIQNFGNPNNSILSNIIFWKTKSDIEPFALLSYSNQDGGNSFCYKVENKEINNLTLQLVNENNELITDAPDYLVALQFNFYKIDDQSIKIAIISINKLLNEIYTTLIFGLKRLNLL